MLLQNEREHLNALIRAVSDRAGRVEELNRMAGESPVIYDKKVQKQTVAEALEEAQELRAMLDEAIALMEKGQIEELEVYAGNEK